MMKSIRKKKYEGFSLIEMLITIVIIGIVMLISSSVLTTLIKVSTVSSNKARVRNESEYILELLRRTIRTSNPEYIYIFDTTNVRRYDSVTGKVVDTVGNVSDTYLSQIEPITGEGNEIHFRPYGQNYWVCLAFFKDRTDENKGYILRTSMDNLSDTTQANCFSSVENPSYNYILLTSRFINMKSFIISYVVTEDENYLIQFNLDAESIYWYFGSGAPVTRNVFRQAIVKTESLIW